VAGLIEVVVGDGAGRAACEHNRSVDAKAQRGRKLHHTAKRIARTVVGGKCAFVELERVDGHAALEAKRYGRGGAGLRSRGQSCDCGEPQSKVSKEFFHMLNYWIPDI